MSACLGSAWGKDIGVLIDVSGTMGNYGAWQDDAKRLTASLMSGNPSASGWKHEGNESAAADFQVQNSDRIYLIRFGSIQSREFPFFAPPRSLTTPRDYEAEFPVDAARYREARTNKPLAIAVGVRLTADNEGAARLIVISDFLVDSDVSVDQQETINQFESKARVESPLIYAWEKNPHVQVKLLRISGMTPKEDLATSPIRVQITGARLFESPKRLLLSWTLSGGDTDASYTVTIREPNSGKTILTRTVLNSSLLVPNPPSGKFVWQVSAKLSGNRSAVSPVTPLEIPGGSPLWILFVVLAAAAGFGLWQYSKRRRPPPELERKDKTSWKR